MNKRFLIAIDLDGTLLNKKKKISWANKSFLRKLQKQGHIVVLASGRPSRALRFYQQQIGLKTPIICYNGAYCYNPYDKNFKETAYNFPLHVIRQIYKDLGPDVYSNVMCETDEEIWLIEKDDRLNAFFWQEDMDIIYGDLDKTLNKDPWTMIIQLRDRNHDQEVIKAVTKHEGFAIRFWYTYPYAEVYHLKTSKAACIYDIAEYYDIPISNCIAIGDADNDIEMLTKVGFGIAMKNGNENVKKLAHLISKKDNNHSGVKQAIKVAMKFLNNKL